jgi:hypothetical protein
MHAAFDNSALVLARLLGGREVLFKRLLADSPVRVARARFGADELPSRGDVTVESDRERIAVVEADICKRFVRYCALREKVVFASTRGSARTHRLDRMMVGCVDVPQICADLLAEPAVGSLAKLSLRGNRLGALGIASLMRALVCVKETSALFELELSGNTEIGVGGAQAIAIALGHADCTIRRLSLAGCALEPQAGLALARGLLSAHSLELLDLSRNRLTDAVVVSLHEAARTRPHGSTASPITLIVDGNPISRGVFQLAHLGHLTAAGLHERRLRVQPSMMPPPRHLERERTQSGASNASHS